MARHNETGKLGEQLARNWAEENGYSIRTQNWRYGHWEIDLVASRAGRLHFLKSKPEGQTGSGILKNWWTRKN